MGRPRKRRNVDGESPPPREASTPDEFVNVTGPDLAAFPVSGYETHQTLALDPALNLFEQPFNSGMDFLDLLPNPYDTLPEHQHHGHYQQPPQIWVANHEQYDGAMFPLQASGVDLLDGIDFNDPEASTTVSKQFSDTMHHYLASQYTHSPFDRPESTLSDRSTSVPSPEPYAQPHAMKPVPSVNCGCLSSLYLALDSLTHLPHDVTAAMRVARNASKVAHDVISCNSCSGPLLEEVSMPPPIQCFQNMMLLGALLPSACNAYAAILEMVDAETARAKEEGRNFWFTFKDVGGLWGNMVDEGAGGQCGLLQSYNNRSMPPDMWRTTIRAIMRLDVYGFGAVAELDINTGYTQLGLKDVVALLDERSRERHDALDRMIASGQAAKEMPYVMFPGGVMRSIDPEQRNCYRIVEAARSALDNLVIA